MKLYRLILKVYLVLSFCSLVSFQLLAQTAAVIKGTVQDSKSGDLLPGVVVYVLETGSGTISDNEGRFKLVVKPGVYTVQFSFIGFIKQQHRITIGSREQTNFIIKFESQVNALANVDVRANRAARSEKALLEIRRKSAVIQDAISAEQIEKTASITTAQALQRVTGVTLRDGKYITVRGLTDRNLVVQLNGSRLSSANAERSSVALDLIPAPLLDNITVEKTVTPDKPGDATGAVIEIRTRSIPDSTFCQFSIQTGLNSNIGPFGFYNSYADANLGFFGQKVARLNLPLDYRNLLSVFEARGFSRQLGTIVGGIAASISQANIDDGHLVQARFIDNSLKKMSAPLTNRSLRSSPNQIYNFSYGSKWSLKKQQVIGLVLGLNYYDRYTADPNGQNNLYSVKEVSPFSPNIVIPNELNLIPIFKYSLSTGNHQISYGGLASVGFRLNNSNEITFSYNGNFGAEAQSTYLNGDNNNTLQAINPGAGNASSLLKSNSSVYDLVLHSTERALHTFQGRGEHRFFGVRHANNAWHLNWSASANQARQNDPNYRNTRVLIDSSAQVPANPLRGPSSIIVTADYPSTYNVKATSYYRLLNESNQNFKVDLLIPAHFNRKEISFKAGSYYLGRRRSYQEAVLERQERDSLISNNSVRGLGQSYGSLTSLYGKLDDWNGQEYIGLRENESVEGGRPLAQYIPIVKQGPNSYLASSRVVAFYGMADFVIYKSWRLVGGMRIETTDFRSTPDTIGVGFVKNPLTNLPIISQNEFNKFYVTDYTTYNWLPSGSLVYNGIKNANLRLAFSKTLARPELTEIVQSSQNDPLQQATILGNKNLKNGEFLSFDFRTDYFPRSEELFSFSAYFKKVSNQIERIYQPRLGTARSSKGLFKVFQSVSSQYDEFGDARSIITFRNNLNVGFIYGFEFEFRKKLDQIFSLGKYVSLGTNLLLARSTTKITDGEYYVASQFDRNLSPNRPLIDQPNFALNINVGFEHPKWGTSVSFLYNKTGKRLILVNVDGTPNIYDFPAATFDLIYSQKFGRRWQLKTFVKNILNGSTEYLYLTPSNIKTFGTLKRPAVNRSFGTGTEYTFGLNYLF